MSPLCVSHAQTWPLTLYWTLNLSILPSYFTLVLESDLRFFDGVNTFQDLKLSHDFRMPNKANILAKVEDLTWAHGPASLDPTSQPAGPQ